MKPKSVVLIVEDDTINLHVLVSLLKDDYEIKVATNGVRALELAQIDPLPDLILLDISMPGMDGYEVLSHLKECSTTSNIPIIFVTGSITIDDEEKGLGLGAVDYITKPISPAIVKARVHTHLKIKHQHDELLYNATHDQLTGLYNRHVLSQEGERKFARAKRHGDKLSIIILDIDNFKVVNDDYGHIMGDKVIVGIANILNKNMRTEDCAARFGGEEFIIILENCDANNASKIADDFRKRIASTQTEGISVTASFGLCELKSKHKTFDSLIKDADSALYDAKEDGRNKVKVCS